MDHVRLSHKHDRRLLHSTRTNMRDLGRESGKSDVVVKPTALGAVCSTDIITFVFQVPQEMRVPP